MSRDLSGLQKLIIRPIEAPFCQRILVLRSNLVFKNLEIPLVGTVNYNFIQDHPLNHLRGEVSQVVTSKGFQIIRVRSTFKKSLPETNSKFAPENRPLAPTFKKETKKYSNHPVSGAFAVSFREGIHLSSDCNSERLISVVSESYIHHKVGPYQL